MPTRSRLQELLLDGSLRPEDLRELERLACGRVVLAALGAAPQAAESELVESRIREILEHAPVLVWRTDERGAVFMNRAYCEFVGKPLEELVPFGWMASLHPQDAEAYLSAFREAFARRERFEAQVRLRRWDGAYRWLKAVGLPQYEDGRFTGYLGSSFDVTDIKAAEQLVRERERWFAEIVDVSPGILWVTDSQGVCTYLSRRWYELTGQPVDEGLGLGWLDATHPDDKERTGAAFRQAIENHSRFGFEYRLKVQGNDYRWCLDQGEPRFDADGRFLGHVGQVIDIEERKAAELLKAQATLELEMANRRKDEFLAVLAHELRNPLAPIASGLHIVQRMPGTDSARRAVGVMERQLAHMVRLIDDLMDLSRITRGKIELKRARVDLREVAERSCEGAQALFDRRGQTLAAALPDAPVWVRVDAARLVQVVTNLLTNASRYSAPGTQVRLALRCEGDGTQAVLTVQDQGVGIPPERMDAVFEMFSPLNTELGRPHEGLGIGLALSRNLVAMHGGTLEAHSAGLGKGATFTVRLPVCPPPSLPPEGGGARLPPPLGEGWGGGTPGRREADFE